MKKETESLNELTAPQIRSNEFELNFSMKIAGGVQLIINEHSISTGQPWDNSINVTMISLEKWKMAVQAGRHKTEEVANWFKTKIKGGAALGCKTQALLPDALNFAFSCTLYIKLNTRQTTKFSNLIIAQGNNGNNNWWIGSANLHNRDNGNFIYSDDKRIKLDVSCYGVNGFNFEVSLGDWMFSLADTTKVTSLSIPGTHDTGTYKISKAKFGSRCQNNDITRQLEDGIRFFDIRLKNNDVQSNDPLQLYHDIFDCDVSFGDVMQSCVHFLAQHPSEIILVSVKNEQQGEKISNNFIKYLKKYPNSYYRGNKLTTLKDLRGKILFLYRFVFEPVSGFEKDKVGVMFGPWQDDTSFESTNSVNQKFQIEDNYNEHDTHKKVDFVEKNLKKAVAQDALFVTFNSISAGAHSPYQYAWGTNSGTVDPIMNIWLQQYTAYTDKKCMGIIPLDFYNNSGENPTENALIINIVNSNF